MNFQRCSFIAFTVASLIPRCAGMDATEKTSRIARHQNTCNFLLKRDNTVGPKDRSLFLLCRTFNFLSASDFYSLMFLVALFFYVSKHFSLFSGSFKLTYTQYLKKNFSKLTSSNFH